jgi:pimeloyl-ACP methyl ester carboxylesterase
MSITTVEGKLIHYEVLGRGKPLLFIHGWLGSWRYWWSSMQAMSTAQHRSFAFDLWGFGDSSKAPELYSINDYVNMVDQFIDALGIFAPVTVIGHSLGAIVGMKFAAQHSDKVEKVVGISAPVTGEHVNGRLISTEPQGIIERVLTKADNFSEVDNELRKTDLAAFNQLAIEARRDDFTADILNLPKPLLLIHGGQDTLIFPPTGEHAQMQQNTSGRFFVSLDHCSHFPMLQESRQFNRLLLDFFLAGDDLTELVPKEYWTRRVR